MDTRVTPIDLGFDTCYLLQAEGCILIDGGQPKRVGVLERQLRKYGVDPKEIAVVLLTHAHWDHMGSAADIRELTGAEVWVHRSEADWVRSGDPPLPPGITPWGRTFIAIHRLFLPLIRVPPTPVDRELGDETFRLDEVGIPGLMLHTPGHSPGGMTIVLDSGEAFVGDQAMNRMPLCTSPSLTIFAHEPEKVRPSWGKVLEHPVHTVYPAHGPAFGVDVMRRLLEA